MAAQLQQRDREILQDLYRFNGLPAEAIIGRFSCRNDGYRRLRILKREGYVARKYYYAKNNNNRAQRIATIYYVMPKGLKAINIGIDPRMVRPYDDELDVHNLIGRLYLAEPRLLSKRETLKRYDLKGFMPVSCSIPGKPPVFIHILGKDKNSLEEKTWVVSFIEAQILPAEHVIISRNFDKIYLTPEARYIPWDMAVQILPIWSRDRDVYINKLKKYFLTFYPEAIFFPKDPFIIARTRRGIFHLAELVSGSCFLRMVLASPPPNTLVFVENRRCLEGVNLEQGSFFVYSEQENQVFEIFLKDGWMYIRPVESL